MGIDFDKCEKLISESIKLDPSIDNDAYGLKLDYLKLKKNNILKNEKTLKVKGEKIEKIDDEFLKLIDQIGDINKYKSEYVKIKRDYILYKKDLILVKNFISEIEEIKSKISREDSRDLINDVAFIFNEIMLYTKDEIKGVQNYELLVELGVDEFFCSYKNSELKSKNLIFMIELSKYIIAKKNDFVFLSEILDCILKISDSIGYINKICERFLIVQDESITNKLELYIKSNKTRLSGMDYLYSMSMVEKSRGNYQESLGYYKKYFAGSDSGDDFIGLIYSCLVAGDYENVDYFISREDRVVEGLSKMEKIIVDINKLTSKKLKYGELKEIDKTLLKSIISKNSDDKRILICANSLLDLNSEALHHIKEIILSNYTFYYEFLEWPAINKYLKDEMIKYFENLVEIESKMQVA